MVYHTYIIQCSIFKLSKRPTVLDKARNNTHLNANWAYREVVGLLGLLGGDLEYMVSANDHFAIQNPLACSLRRMTPKLCAQHAHRRSSALSLLIRSTLRKRLCALNLRRQYHNLDGCSSRTQNVYTRSASSLCIDADPSRIRVGSVGSSDDSSATVVRRPAFKVGPRGPREVRLEQKELNDEDTSIIDPTLASRTLHGVMVLSSFSFVTNTSGQRNVPK